MAFKCGFFNSVDNDRLYTAEDMNNVFNLIVSNGVIIKESNSMQVVSVNNMNIAVKVGSGIFAGKWSLLDADMEFVVPTPHVTNPRIDSVVVTIKTHNDYRTGVIEYVAGTPDASPEAPQIEFHDPWRGYEVCQYRLANILVKPNVTSISQSDITDTRPSSECGFVTNLLQDSDITATYAQWQEQFERWFNNIKDTLNPFTAVMSYQKTYITVENGEQTIPVGIDRFNSALDVLQVSCNGLTLIEGLDYTRNGYESITLTLPVSSGAILSFVVLKSIDGEESTTVVDELQALTNKVAGLETSPTPLWVGSVLPLATDTIIPTKKLSQCKSGWLLLWCDYNEDTQTAGNFDYSTTFIPKMRVNGTWSGQSFLDIIGASLADSGDYFMAVKKLAVHDDRITGFVGNGATTYGRDICLRAIYEV